MVTDTTEMCMSATLYDALDTAGFSGAVMDGRNWVMQWREQTHLYSTAMKGRTLSASKHLVPLLVAGVLQSTWRPEVNEKVACTC